MLKQIYKINFILFLVFAVLSPFDALAFEVIKFPETQIKNDFVVSPAKMEIVMKPGERQKQYITVLNRFGEDYNFTVTVEDFSPSKDSGNPVLEENKVSDTFSFKNYVKPDANSFFLRQGSQARIVIDVALPNNISPGGKYSAVLISASPRQKVDSATTIVSRIGSLLLVKVDGVVEESGQLSNFVFKDRKFWISYKNDGNVHLNSYGIIEIKNEAGVLVETIQIDPWIILPGSTRSRFLLLSGEIPNGKYIAKALINRGYKDIIDSKEISFRLGAIPVISEVKYTDDDLDIGYYVAGLFAILLVFVWVVFRKRR